MRSGATPEARKRLAYASCAHLVASPSEAAPALMRKPSAACGVPGSACLAPELQCHRAPLRRRRGGSGRNAHSGVRKQRAQRLVAHHAVVVALVEIEQNLGGYEAAGAPAKVD